MIGQAPSTFASSTPRIDWQDASWAARQPGSQRWRRLLWALLFSPQTRANRVIPTLVGIILFGIAVAIGLAAYNTSSNILFITLSLLLSCLILNGLLSWMNVRRVDWRLQTTMPWRVGQEQFVQVDLRNRKRVLPTYGIWFDLALARSSSRVRVKLRQRLDAGGGSERLEWPVRPMQRGVERVQLAGLGSLFPFGFQKRLLVFDHHCDVVVWPAPVEYHRLSTNGAWQAQLGKESRRQGQGGELLSLRKYASGDAQRLVHWKATARLRSLMVRQYAAESQDGFTLCFEAWASSWLRAEQFELAIRLAATLAEDLFREGQLRAASLNDEVPAAIRSLGDLEHFLDRLAQVVMTERAPASAGADSPEKSCRLRGSLLTFAPEGLRSVMAYIDGHPAATA